MPAADVQPTPSARHPRRKAPLVARRRGRKQHEEEDDETVATEESYTDESGSSDGTYSDEESEDEEDAEEVEEDLGPANGGKVHAPEDAGKPPTDTEVMKNGMGNRAKDAHEVDFEEMGNNAAEPSRAANLEIRGKAPVQQGKEAETEGQAEEVEPSQPQGARPETFQERNRREHEEYKRKRAEDPAFVPNRGNFFMHDHRYDGAGSNGFRPFNRGGARGRGRFGGFNAPVEPAENRWDHDMHEKHEAEARSPASQQPLSGYPANAFIAGRQRAPNEPRAFGRTVQKGTVQIQVNLPEMKAPITFSEVPLKMYTRLPFHRPPLRRDKPVRIALPDTPVRYIYPSVQRSFIFIPRAMRPGGSGYIRGNNARGRGGYGSGRSMYGGGGSTLYSPSVGMSRRSSMQYDFRQQTPAQPQNHLPPSMPMAEERQTGPPPPHGDEEAARPVVRLPNTPSGKPATQFTQPPPQQQPQQPQQQQPPVPVSDTTPRMIPQHPPPSYTPNPVPYRETRATPKIPMHQPRPQKAVNVAEIDSPAVMHFPQNYNGGVYDPTGTPVMNGYAQHARHPSYPSQASGTPLSQIPETMHPRQFHPNAYPPPQQSYYGYPPHPQGPPPPMHHMPQPPQHPGAFHHPPPPYVPSGPSPMPNGATNHYTVIPPPQPVPPVAVPVPVPVSSAPPPPPPVTGPATMAVESNGMVYYSTYDPNQYNYSYGYSGTPGMPITPAPDGTAAMSAGSAVYYYPATGTPGYYGQ